MHRKGQVFALALETLSGTHLCNYFKRVPSFAQWALLHSKIHQHELFWSLIDLSGLDIEVWLHQFGLQCHFYTQPEELGTRNQSGGKCLGERVTLLSPGHGEISGKADDSTRKPLRT
ncbi:hypothetical protein J6590_062821 [Homalodisca vitripennis]|nr:hypothetical protein J6590_062821 [Homalodisca vitripennis]